MTYHELQRRRVRSSDGRYLGRMTDLVAGQRGDALRVTGLLIGPPGFLRRLGLRHAPLLRRAAPRAVPWRLVDRIEKDIILSIDAEAFHRLERGARSIAGRESA